MAYLIFQALISVGMIIGGIATESLYLAIVGCIWLIAEIFQIVSYKNKQEKKKQEMAGAQPYYNNMGVNAPQQWQGQNPQQADPYQNQTLPQYAQSPQAQPTSPYQAETAWLTVSKNIKIVPAGEARSENYRAYLNGEFVAESGQNGIINITCKMNNNLLQIQSFAGVWAAPFYFMVVDESSQEGELFIGKDTFGEPIVLLSAGLSFTDTMKGIKKLA